MAWLGTEGEDLEITKALAERPCPRAGIRDADMDGVFWGCAAEDTSLPMDMMESDLLCFGAGLRDVCICGVAEAEGLRA